jgi:signal peptidase I
MDLLSRTLRAAVRVTVAFLVLAALVAMTGLAVLPRLGLYRPLTVLSGSMEPTFHPGDLVIVTPEPLSDVRTGQVIAYSTPVADHHVVTHRVIEVVHGGPTPTVRTQGDANPAPDPWTAQLHGGTAWQMRLVIPHAGWVVRFLRDPQIHRITVLVVPLILCLVWLREIWAPGERREPRRAARVA